MTALELRIPKPLHSANVNRGAHWSTRHKETKAWEAEIWVALHATKGWRLWIVSPERQEPRRLTITRHHPSRRVSRTDPDNLMFAGKGIRDAMKRLRLIVDDSAIWLESAVVDAWTPGEPAHTTIRLERAEGENR